MKKNRMMRLAAILLVCVLLTTSVISGTFAKYTSEATGNDEARVAKWSIKLEDAKMEETFTFDLFNTVYDTDGNVEQDIANNNGSIIAPGTKGSFVLNLENNSEVNAKYSVDYTLTNEKKVPVLFSVDGTHWYNDINYIDVAGAAMNMGDAPAITVQWQWIFENGVDDADTSLGVYAVNDNIILKVDAKVTVEQVD